MAKARIPLMIQDPSIRQTEDAKQMVEGYDPIRPYFLDGPATERVAVLDFDPETHQLVSGVHYDATGARGAYVNAEEQNLYELVRDSMDAVFTPEFMQVNVFATVLRTIDQFEKEDERGQGLGRAITWAFDGPQLLVVPRAGKDANAYYERDAHSLQFFFFPSREWPHKMIYSCLSRDIIAHETGHAIIDSIVPDLMDAYTPESLAIHEGLADLTALLVAFSSHNLRALVLRRPDGSIADPSHFNTIAEEFGMGRGHGHGLRSLLNRRNLIPDDPECVRTSEPHDLSEVLSGALYAVVINLHARATDELVLEFQDERHPRYSASGKALALAARRFKQMIFRALDYLPPGEVSFSDYGRAIIAVDQTAYPEDEVPRDWLRAQFLERAIVTDPAALEVKPAFDHDSLKDVTVADLHHSDWAAYEFARNNRPLLNIPADISFKVEPRLELNKELQNGEQSHECIFKVSWSRVEPNDIADSRYPPSRRLVVGTTLALDWESSRVLSCLTSAPPNPDYQPEADPAFQLSKEEHANQQARRDEFLAQLIDRGLLKIGSEAFGPDGRLLDATIQGEVVNQVLRIRRTANLLHLVGGD